MINNETTEYIWRNWKRYLDDGFIPWKKHFGDVEVFINLLNSLYTGIKFTYETHQDKIPYLNVLVYKGGNGLMCDIYFKDTDSREYLPFRSCHEHHTKTNIPFTLSRMICTIVEDVDIRRSRLRELRLYLLNCGYPLSGVNNAIYNASSIDQKELRIYKDKQQEDNNLVFVTTFNPRNPNMKETLNKVMIDFVQNIRKNNWKNSLKF